MRSTTPTPDWEHLRRVDAAHVWHPFTQMKEAQADPPVPVAGASGAWLTLADGSKVLDGISSWWTTVHGHGHPRLVEALTRQARALDHVMFAGFTHAPGVELAEALTRRLPPTLTRCFFSDDGSTAVEVALKMTFQAQLQRGQGHRHRFGALHGGYHGDTLGAVGVGELSNYATALFSPLLVACERVDVPADTRREFSFDAQAFAASLEAGRQGLRAFFAAHGASLAAFIAEPLVQGAGGFRFWPPELLQELRALCTAHGVFLVLDEVMTGFGRTGTFFAHTQAGVEPDALCLSKGLAGMLPLALTCATEELFACFWGDPASGRAFLHGHSFTGNPLACAVAVAGLRLFDDEAVLPRVAALGDALETAWRRLAGHPAVRHARRLGPCVAANLVDPRTGVAHPPEARAGWRLHRRALEHGLLVRPMGDCLYLLPPYCTTQAEVAQAVDTLLTLL